VSTTLFQATLIVMEFVNRAATAAITALALPLSSSTVEFKTNPKKLKVVTHNNIINFKDPSDKTTTLEIKPWQTIRDVKAKLAKKTATRGFELLVDNEKLVSELQCQHLFFQGQVLKDSNTLQDYNISTGDTIYHRHAEVQSKEPSSRQARVQVVLGGMKCPPELQSKIEKTQNGLAKGIQPKLAPSGLGGTYFLHDDKRRIVGVFKPEDEEAYCPNNPRGLAGRMRSRSVRNGLLSGEANIREVAAYLLDHEKFANVPETVRVEVSHPTFGAEPKIGSFQEFKPHDDEAGDVSASLFSVEGAHRIAIMDMRLVNRDRNDENLLVKKNQNEKDLELIPIDHGCSLPDSLEVNWYDWAWLSWPQTKQPLSPSEKEYIARLDAEHDASLLNHELNIRWQCLMVLRVATLFLQKGAAADLSLFDIASMMSRDDEGCPSTLEVVLAQATTLAEKKQLGGRTKRRSPQVSPSTNPLPDTTLRKSQSCLELSLVMGGGGDTFKLPGVMPDAELSHKQSPSDDFGAWALEDTNQDLFDGVFFQYLNDMMDTAVTRKKLKRQAVNVFKLARPPLKTSTTSA